MHVCGIPASPSMENIVHRLRIPCSNKMQMFMEACFAKNIGILYDEMENRNFKSTTIDSDCTTTQAGLERDSIKQIFHIRSFKFMIRSVVNGSHELY